MNFFKRKIVTPTFAVHNLEGQKINFGLTFKNGEIHINPNAMDKGTYVLSMIEGERKEIREFVVE
jgi:hypothetical protein